MKFLAYIIMLASLVISQTDLFSQSIYINNEDHKKFNFRVNFDEDSKPYMEINYGFTEYKHKSFSDNFAKTGSAELRLGSRVLSYLDNEGISDFQGNFLFIGGNSQSLRGKNQTGLKSELVNFGIGTREGYGYRIGAVDIIPYSGFSISWNRLNMTDYPDSNINLNSVNDTEILDRYQKSIRFGHKIESGLVLAVNETFYLDAGYQANIVFPRFMGWKHMGSAVLELAALGLTDEFIDRIIDSSPKAAPIVNFLLKNAITYGFYILQRDKMNFPFDSERPLTFETFKIGVSVAF